MGAGQFLRVALAHQSQEEDVRKAPHLNFDPVPQAPRDDTRTAMRQLARGRNVLPWEAADQRLAVARVGLAVYLDAKAQRKELRNHGRRVEQAEGPHGAPIKP